MVMHHRLSVKEEWNSLVDNHMNHFDSADSREPNNDEMTMTGTTKAAIEEYPVEMG